MARRLTAHERALWSRVAATVRPLGGQPAPPPAPPPELPKPAILPKVAIAKPIGVGVPPDRAARSRPRVPVSAATLDGSWDRRLRQGDISPDRIIDLHGHSLGAAYEVLAAALDGAGGRGERILLVITGKGRSDRPGRIRAELAHWLEGAGLRERIAALRPAHPRHGGSGAFYLILRRRG